MKKNMGNTDRIIRTVVAVVAAVLYFTGTISGVLGMALLVVALIFLATSLVSTCPIYTLTGLRTNAPEKE